jgi:hypothetical protein
MGFPFFFVADCRDVKLRKPRCCQGGDGTCRHQDFPRSRLLIAFNWRLPYLCVIFRPFV